MVPKVNEGKKGNLARMALLERKENQDHRGLSDLQEQLLSWVPRERKEIKETVAYLGKEGLKVIKENLDLQVFRVQWEYQACMANMAPQVLLAFEATRDILDNKENLEYQALKDHRA